MKISYLALLILIIPLTGASAQPTIFIVRHAEAVEDWPADSLAENRPLTPQGAARAQKLAERFNKKSLAAIYSSRTARTIKTAEPLAKKLGLSIKLADACMDTTGSVIEAFFKQLERNHGDSDSVLLVTHSNIIPQMLIKAGLPQQCFKRLGLTRLPHYEGWLIEGYDAIWRIRWGNRDEDCKGLELSKF